MTAKYLFKYTRLIVILGDGLLLNFFFFIGYHLSYPDVDQHIHYPFTWVLLVVNTCWLIASLMQKKNAFYRISGNMKIFRGSMLFILFHFLLIHTFIGITHLSIDTPWILFNVYVPALIAVPFWRYCIKELLAQKREEGHNLKKVIIIGTSAEAVRLGNVLKAHPEYGYQFEGYFDNVKRTECEVRGSITEAEKYFVDQDIDEIYCAINAITNEESDRLMELAESNFKRINFVPTIKPAEQLQRYKIEYYDQLPIMVMPSSPLDKLANQSIKRVFDIALSALVIVFILSWLLPIISLLIFLDSRGPVFYKQKRSGLNNTSFWCWKFRSMYVNGGSFTQATKDDPRVTRVGAVLRKTNLDELPQFFNVLIGNMSIIGPRPHPVELDSQYMSSLAGYKRRLSVKPGITGLSQVRGYRGETNEEYLMRNRVTMDIFYAENWSLLFDFKIVLLTIITTLNGDSRAY